MIPQDIREENNIKEGERFLVYDAGDSIVLKRIKNLESAKNIDEFEKVFSSMWKTAKARRIDKKDIAKEIEAYRRENA